MIITKIHDLSNIRITNLLMSALSKIKEPAFIKNYHPDYKNTPGNLFYILENGRYKLTKGSYYVLEHNKEFLCSAGWNEYELDKDVALLLTRMYTTPPSRMNYYHATYILPKILEQTAHYKYQWATMNEHNRGLYEWFLRTQSGKTSALFNNWPDIYKNFKPIGKKAIYYTEQYVVEYIK